MEVGVSLFNQYFHVNKFEIIIVGGGLAGLSLAILCGRKGMKVLLFEKDTYPRQKVCGEYISMESYDFLSKLGVPLQQMDVPLINQFVLTNPYTNRAQTTMKMGGFGLSRYTLDEYLYNIALQLGVTIYTNTKISAIEKSSNGFEVKSSKGELFVGDLVVAAYGRISGLNASTGSQRNEFIGIKYHIDVGPQSDTIEIHGFNGGYCGVSKVEGNDYNLCYLAKASDFKACRGDVSAFENEVLKQNKFLAERLDARKLMEPIVTSKLFFGTAQTESVPYLQIGDAAGFIPPITGNGMSLAFRSANVLFHSILRYQTQRNYTQLKQENAQYIHNYLKGRIIKGILLQSVLLNPNRTFNKILYNGLSSVPGLLGFMTKQAVGEPIQ